jgi:hypothetical protein
MLEVFLPKGNDLGDTLYGLKRHHFPPHFAHFFDRSKLLLLTKICIV